MAAHGWSCILPDTCTVSSMLCSYVVVNSSLMFDVCLQLFLLVIPSSCPSGVLGRLIKTLTCQPF